MGGGQFAQYARLDENQLYMVFAHTKFVPCMWCGNIRLKFTPHKITWYASMYAILSIFVCVLTFPSFTLSIKNVNKESNEVTQERTPNRHWINYYTFTQHYITIHLFPPH